MSLPDQLVLEGFRSFAGPAALPISPITLVYGANNSGKSALLRAMALLGSSLEPETTGAVRLPERAFPGGRFQDLAWQGEAGNYAWKIGLRWSRAGVTEALYTLNGSSDSDPYISRLDLRRMGPVGLWRARANEDRLLVDPDEAKPLHFQGLIPQPNELPDLREQLLALRGRVRWLAGVRRPPPRAIDVATAEKLVRLGNGEGTAEALAADAELRDNVGRFYANLDNSRRLAVHEAPPLGRWLSLNPATQPGWRVHINDTGEGMAQVLPVLVHAAYAARDGGILAVEEPESHLYPSAQRALARHLCELTLSNPSPRFILETHSRVFLLAVQLEVAKGYPADNVRVVWVDQRPNGRSTTTEVRMRENGQLGDGWPPSALGEDLNLARELTRMGRVRVEGA